MTIIKFVQLDHFKKGKKNMKNISLIIIIIIISYDLSAQKIKSSVFGAGNQVSNNTFILNGSAFQTHSGVATNIGYKMNVGFWNIYKNRLYNAPSITTSSISNVQTTTATSGGSISLNNTDPDVIEKGIVWGTSPNPTLNNNVGYTQNGPNPQSGNSLTFISNMTGLSLNTTYYVRAYLTNSNSTYYGNQVVFTTIPTLGEWGVIALVSLMGIFGVWMVYRKV